MKAKNIKNRYSRKQNNKKLNPKITRIILWILIISIPVIDQYVDLGWFDPAFEMLGLLIGWIQDKIK